MVIQVKIAHSTKRFFTRIQDLGMNDDQKPLLIFCATITFPKGGNNYTNQNNNTTKGHLTKLFTKTIRFHNNHGQKRQKKRNNNDGRGRNRNATKCNI